MADNFMEGRRERRVAILALSARGKTPTEISRHLGVTRQTVYATLKRGTANTPKRMKKRLARPKETIRAVNKVIKKKKGKVTVKGLAREFDMPRTTMRRLVEEDLGLKSYRRTPRQALKPVDCERRLQAAQKCLNRLKKKPPNVVLLHLDETPFSLGEMVSNETGFYLAKASGDSPSAHYGKERHFANLQVIAVVGADGQKCDLIFLKPGERLDSETYMKYLRENIFPWARRTYGESWWLQQDGASCHTSRITQDMLTSEAPGFFPKDCWPPHSPDAAPMDYAIFGRLKSMLSGIQFHSKNQLKSAIVDAWARLDQSFVQKSCKKFRGKLEQIVANNGGLIE